MFRTGYLSSEVYILSFIKGKFDEFDKNKSSHIKVEELEPLLRKIVKELLDETIRKEELDTVIQIVGDGGVTSKEEFVGWFKQSLYYDQARKRN